MENNVDYISDEYTVLDYKDFIEIDDYDFSVLPEVVSPLSKSIKKTFHKIEKLLYIAPEIFDYVKANVPEKSLQLALTDSQKKKLADGTNSRRNSACSDCC